MGHLAYPPGFDSALIDGDSAEVVLTDTHKALASVRAGGIIMWHDFCPDPAILEAFPSSFGVADALSRRWRTIARSLRDAFWIYPSFILLGVRR